MMRRELFCEEHEVFRESVRRFAKTGGRWRVSRLWEWLVSAPDRRAMLLADWGFSADELQELQRKGAVA